LSRGTPSSPNPTSAMAAWAITMRPGRWRGRRCGWGRPKRQTTFQQSIPALPSRRLAIYAASPRWAHWGAGRVPPAVAWSAERGRRRGAVRRGTVGLANSLSGPLGGHDSGVAALVCLGHGAVDGGQCHDQQSARTVIVSNWAAVARARGHLRVGADLFSQNPG